MAAVDITYTSFTAASQCRFALAKCKKKCSMTLFYVCELKCLHNLHKFIPAETVNPKAMVLFFMAHSWVQLFFKIELNPYLMKTELYLLDPAKAFIVQYLWSLRLHSHRAWQPLPLLHDKGCSCRAGAPILLRHVHTEIDSDTWPLEACPHFPPSNMIPTLWFRLPGSPLSTYNEELAAAS